MRDGFTGFGFNLVEEDDFPAALGSTMIIGVLLGGLRDPPTAAALGATPADFTANPERAPLLEKEDPEDKDFPDADADADADAEADDTTDAPIWRALCALSGYTGSPW